MMANMAYSINKIRNRSDHILKQISVNHKYKWIIFFFLRSTKLYLTFVNRDLRIQIEVHTKSKLLMIN